MNVHVTVELDGDTLVAVKTATAAPAVDRLRHEAARLADASHPGVVRVVGCRDLEPAGPAGDGAPSCELRTAYAGEPLTRWTASLTDIGGLAASVASTLADLHDAGIVHGRLDASHVLLGDGGRPQLCGWAGPDGAGPADDVAAWGRLVEDLLARAPSPRRGLRATRGAGPRARRAVREVVDRALDPIPTRRPSARALADMVIAAVPGAALPSAGPTASGRGVEGGAAPPHRHRGDTLDRIWSYAGEPTEEERWAAAFGSVPDDLVPEAARTGRSPQPTRGDLVVDPQLHSQPTASTTSSTHGLPLAEVDALDWDAPSADGPGAGGGLAEPPFLDEPSGDPTRDATHGAAADDDRTRDHVPVGTRRRTLPTDGDASADPRGGRVTAVGAAVAVAALVTVGLTGAAIARGPGGDADATRPAATPPSCGQATPPAADVDGDGCLETLAVEGSTIDAGVARWTLGEPGDMVTVGDWDCDGDASAALLRPATGDVFVFATWAELDRPVTVSAVDQVAGGTAVRAEPAAEGPPCDRLVVDLAGGGVSAVAVPR
jgi:hypothetical protein